jgi:VanZ family protein
MQVLFYSFGKKILLSERRSAVNTKRIIFSSITILLTVFWICFIFSNSAESAEESSSKSESVQEIVNEVIEAVGGEGNVTEHTVRKFAHFFEFAVLAVLFTADLLSLGLIPFPLRKNRSLLWFIPPLILSVALATADEYLQSFSEGRGPSAKDVGIDSLGALCGLCLSFLLILFVSILYSNKKANKTKNQ